ncbi:MAG TPA: hypothetical protein VLT16_14840 [Candidatus Limnocylindrales bacterium]|nr:hypothetical protein [Candidatus Limnocylindrales bacterium]
MLMRVLYGLLVLSIGAILVALGGTLWRLRWHMRRSRHEPQHLGEEVPPVQEPAKKM